MSVLAEVLKANETYAASFASTRAWKARQSTKKAGTIMGMAPAACTAITRNG
jgi:hypothetical protein